MFVLVRESLERRLRVLESWFKRIWCISMHTTMGKKRSFLSMIASTWEACLLSCMVSIAIFTTSNSLLLV